MKTFAAISIVLLFATGVLKQNVVTFHAPKIFDRIEYLSCYSNEFSHRDETHILAADAARKCRREVNNREIGRLLALHKYEAAAELARVTP